MDKSINWRLIGPGIVLAAAGVGAGDVVASGVAGASFGMVLLWALFIGALFKYFLNEGMARYQLATGRTFMEGYTRVFKGFNYYFIAYLAIWSFLVGGALLSGIGLVSSVMVPLFSAETWGILSALIVLCVVYSGSYKVFERIMKTLALLMFVCFLICAFRVLPSFMSLIKGLVIPAIPEGEDLFGSIFKLFALMGGVGGTVTIMAYSYWIRENNVRSREDLPSVQLDLAIGYFITFLFGMCVMIVAASLIHPTGGTIAGKKGIIDLAKTLSAVLGPFGFWAFIVGFWAAIFSSLISFYQAIPYLFCDAIRLVQNKTGEDAEAVVHTKSRYYRGYVLYNVFPPMLLLFLKKPVFLILCYAVLGAFFMPFLALMLLIIGNHRELAALKNRSYHNIVFSLIFIVMMIIGFWPLLKRYLIE